MLIDINKTENKNMAYTKNYINWEFGYIWNA